MPAKAGISGREGSVQMQSEVSPSPGLGRDDATGTNEGMT